MAWPYPVERRGEAQRLEVSLPAPREGWVTFLLLWASLATVVWSVERARWVPSPPLVVPATVGLLAGLAAARTDRLVWARLPLALLLGVLVVSWQGALMTGAETWGERYALLIARLWAWTSAALGRGISTDLLPFGVLLAFLAWFAAFLSGWGTFRSGNLWWAVLPGGVGLLTNLSYLPAEFHTDFYLYLVPTLLLALRLARRQQARRREREGLLIWRDRGDPAGPYLLLLVLLAVGVTAFLPARAVVNEALQEKWEYVRWPIHRLEEEFNRLFGSVPGRKPGGYFRRFGAFLPIQGRPLLTDDPVFIARTPVPLYWRANIYVEYTGTGWRQGPTLALDLPPQGPLPVPPFLDPPLEEESGEEVSFQIEMRVPSSILYTPGVPHTMNRAARLVVPRPRSHLIYLTRSLLPRNENLPKSLQATAGALVQALQVGEDLPPAERAQAVLTLLGRETTPVRLFLDRDGQAVSLSLDPERARESLASALAQEGTPIALEVVRRRPLDVNTAVARPRLGRGETFDGRAWVSTARPEDLRSAGQDYPDWVREQFLSLPESLPARVAVLARQIVIQAGAENPYDMAKAIESFLRSHFRYSDTVEPAPYDADIVDYFLFENRVGYCDHFASAMVVLLRTLGIPARLVSGFAPGLWDPQSNSFIVRERDAHSWPEVYFPGYGWVRFEPTPIFNSAVHGPLEDQTLALLGLGVFYDGGEIPEEGLFEEIDIPLPERGNPVLPFPPATVPGMGPLGGLAAVLLGLLAVGVGGLWALWRLVLVPLPEPGLAYLKVVRLTSLMGLRPAPDETPLEFARRLAPLLPGLEKEVMAVAETYTRYRYGRRPPSPEEAESLTRAWTLLRRALLRRVVRRSP